MTVKAILALAVAITLPPISSACNLDSLAGRFRAARDLDFITEGGDPAKAALQIAHFKQARAAYRARMEQGNSDFLEADYILRRISAAQMAGSSAFLYGPPGSAKSAILRGMTHSPREMVTGEHRLDVFTIQVNELMNDSLVKGFVSEKSLNPEGRKFDPVNNPEDQKALSHAVDGVKKVIAAKLGLSLDQIHNANTMVKFFHGFVDEIDKANPIFAQAMLEILADKLAQYGPAAMKVRTHFVGVTGNMSPYELRDHFTRQGYGSTASAFLDRMIYKVFVHNYLNMPRNREQLLRMAQQRGKDRAHISDDDFDIMYGGGTQNVQLAPFLSRYPDVDVHFLGRVARKAITMDEVTLEVLQELNDKMRSFYRSKERTSYTTEMGKDDPATRLPFYRAPAVFSSRLTMHTPDAVVMSVFHDLLMLPDNRQNGIATEDLVKFMKEGIPVDRFSAWRVQEMALTGAPGDGRLYATGDSNAPVKLIYGDPTRKYDPMGAILREATDPAETRLAKSIEEERAQFAETYREIMASKQSSAKRLGEVYKMLMEMTGRKNVQSNGVEDFFTENDPTPSTTTTVPVNPGP